MRISLLMRREPFDQIFCQTMAGFLSARRGEPVSVRWHARQGVMARPGCPSPWWVNIYLNAIFPAAAPAETFEPLRREFTRSTAGWRRPLQSAYTRAAFSAAGRRWLAHAWVEFAPGITAAENWLIVPGNHKIRILDHAAGTATAVLKDGFDPAFLRAEMHARHKAQAAGVPVPEITRAETAAGWFEERYITGTPLNRLADRALAAAVLASTRAALSLFYQAGARQQSLGEYARRLHADALDCLERCRVIDAPGRDGLRALAGACLDRLAPFAHQPVETTLCHGDFQPANLLWDGSRAWLIDWEYARECQAGYDDRVYDLGSRRPRGLAARLAADVTRQGSRGLPLAWLFLLEELALHLRENANPVFIRPGPGLISLQEEIAACLHLPELCVD